MDYNSVSKNEQEGINIEIRLIYLREILKKWWIIALSAIILAGVGFAVAKVTYVPQYSSQIMFVAYNRDSSLISSGQSSADLNASVTLAGSYKYIFTTTELSTKVAANCGFKDISAEDVKDFISVQVIDETMIVLLTVTTPNAELSEGIANAYMRFYEEAISTAFPNTRLNVVDPPLLAERPNANNDALIYSAVGFLAGALLALLMMIILIIMKDAVLVSDDIRNKLGLKIIGSVNHVSVKTKNGEKRSILLTDRRSGFAFIESFNLIRTQLNHMLFRKGQKVLVVTSTLENEGKTTASINIALALAKNGKEVLLMDGDLRTPAVAKALSINAADDTGIAGILSGSKSLADSIKYSEKYNLYLLLNGKGIPDPSEMLSTTQVGEIIASAKREFDYVVIDTAPSEVVADASILSAFSDAIILVIRQDCAPMRRIKRAIENLDTSGTEIIGCIYNNVKSDMPGRGVKSKYGYGYGYGYGTEKHKHKN